jgi:Short C-terminal domain
MTTQPPRTKGGAPRRHRVLVPLLVVLGAFCILVSTVSIWVREIALDEDTWANQAGQALESPDVQEVLAVYIVDQAYAASDAEARIEAALPEELKPLAGRVSAQLQGAAYEAAEAALARPRVQELWVRANRAGHEQLVAVLEGETERVQLTDGAVVLDLDELVANAADRVGAGEEATAAAQERVEPIVIMRSDELDTLQKAVRVIKALSFWPFLLGIGLWAGAVYLAAGRRRETIRAVAVSLVLIGLILLAVRRLGGNAIVDALAESESVKAAARDVWTIFTAILADSAVAGVAVGLIAIAGTWLAGPTRTATSVRRWAAPTFRDRPLLGHALLAAVILLLLLWGPVGTPRRFLSLAIVTALAFVGLELLRRQTVREFPDALHGEESLRGALAGIGARSRSQPAEADRETKVDRLERLAALHDRGALTDEEYDAEKALILS